VITETQPKASSSNVWAKIARKGGGPNGGTYHAWSGKLAHCGNTNGSIAKAVRDRQPINACLSCLRALDLEPRLCAICGGAGLHKLGCENFKQVKTKVPFALAQAFGRKKVRGQAWAGFQDAVSGVAL
jgi:hypothetical protein